MPLKPMKMRVCKTQAVAKSTTRLEFDDPACVIDICALVFKACAGDIINVTLGLDPACEADYVACATTLSHDGAFTTFSCGGLLGKFPVCLEGGCTVFLCMTKC